MSRINNEMIDKKIQSSGKGLNEQQKLILEKVSEKTWFRQYAKKSKDNLNKIVEKVKDGIKHGKYTYETKLIDNAPKDFIMPKPKKKTTVKKKTTGKKKATGKKKVTYAKRKQKIIEKKKKEFAPSGRQYSATELREGKGSKRAREWRIRNGIPEGDFSTKR